MIPGFDVVLASDEEPAEPVTEKSQLQGGSDSTSLLDSHREHVLECRDQDCFRRRYLRNMEAWKLKLPCGLLIACGTATDQRSGAWGAKSACRAV